MRVLSLLFSFVLLMNQIGCATALQLPSRKSNPQHFTQEVKDDYVESAQEFYKDMERATYIIVDGIIKNGARYDTKFFPITKPLIVSNANGMILEKRIQANQKNQFRDNALTAFGNGKKCFQTWRSVTYIGSKTDKAYNEFDEKYWKYIVLNKDRKIPLMRISEEQIAKMKVNPPNFPMYESVVCAKEEIDYNQDVTILIENILYPNLKREVTWLASKSN